jgi:hypothetical protein
MGRQNGFPGGSNLCSRLDFCKEVRHKRHERKGTRKRIPILGRSKTLKASNPKSVTEMK